MKTAQHDNVVQHNNLDYYSTRVWLSGDTPVGTGKLDDENTAQGDPTRILGRGPTRILGRGDSTSCKRGGDCSSGVGGHG